LPKTRLQLLRNWREVVSKVVEVAERLYPEADVYLVGGAAEDRLTVLSDIDIVITFEKDLKREERAEILAKLWEELEQQGVPSYYPIHLIVLGKGELKRLQGRKEKLSRQ